MIAEPMDPEGIARRIHATLPVVDGHNDLPWAIRTSADGSLEATHPKSHLGGFHTDIERLRRGGVDAQFWSVYVPTWSDAPLRNTLEQIDLVHRMTASVPADLAEATTADEVRAATSRGKIASLLGAEGGHSIENSLGALRMLARLGVRYLTLTHTDTHDWADSATDEARHGGLTAFGEEVVVEMNRLGMLVDISHVSDDTMRHAIEVSRVPVIASHSNARALADHPRNIPDDVLEQVGATGGVVMANFYPGFVVASTAAKSRDMVAAARAIHPAADPEHGYDPAAVRRRVEAELEALRDADPWERGTVADVADHVEHIAAVAGHDHVGLGSDFDGIDITIEGLEDVACYPALTAELVRRSWTEEQLIKLLGGNALRVLEAADAARER